MPTQTPPLADDESNLISHKKNSIQRKNHQPQVACERCGLSCFLELFNGLPEELTHIFLSRQQPVPKGKSLFCEGQPFHGVYAVKKGGIKTYAMDSKGEERILGFYIPGELLGLEAITANYYLSTAVVLEASHVCWLPFNQLDLLGDYFNVFQEHLVQILTMQLTQQQHQFVLSARQSAEERLAAFLINLSERYAKHGLPDQLFWLPMLRSDIANFLGISMETVSRTFNRFQEKKLLNITGKQVQILDRPGLIAFA
ncbi:MAG: helix-turn-helix domain-containing protein [Magnetococcus sp. DMHC-6]